MAGSGKRGAGERILESRHLVGLFLGVVLLCGVFFTLGYVMGRTQYAGAVHASDAPTGTLSSRSPSPKEKAADVPASPPAGEWDFYSKKDNNHLEPAAKDPAPVAASPNGNDSSPSASVPPRQLPGRAAFRPGGETAGAFPAATNVQRVNRPAGCRAQP